MGLHVEVHVVYARRDVRRNRRQQRRAPPAERHLGGPVTAVPRRSFWAMPSASTDEWFAGMIGRFAALASTEPFDPHLTLVGEQVAPTWEHDAVAAVLVGLGPFDVQMVGVDDEDAPFRCVTLRAAPDELSEARRRLLGVLECTHPEPYRPHLSLLYGSLPAAERRSLIAAATLPVRLPSVTIDAVAVWDTSSDRWGEWRELDRWEL